MGNSLGRQLRDPGSNRSEGDDFAWRATVCRTRNPSDIGNQMAIKKGSEERRPTSLVPGSNVK